MSAMFTLWILMYCSKTCVGLVDEVFLAGDMRSKAMYATQIVVTGEKGGVSKISNHLESSLRVRANGVGAKEFSTVELTTPVIKVPREQTDDLTLYGFVKVNGQVSYEVSKMKTDGYLPTSFLEERESADGIWTLVSDEGFGGVEKSHKHWSLMSSSGMSPSSISHCGDGNFFLGGHCVGEAGHEMSKTLKDLPSPHQQLHLTATVHFLDMWKGESAYLKIDGNYVWADSHFSPDGSRDLAPSSACGHPERSDTKMGAKIDVYVPHSNANVTLTFGSTLGGHPCDQSWGVDDVRIMVR